VNARSAGRMLSIYHAGEARPGVADAGEAEDREAGSNAGRRRGG